MKGSYERESYEREVMKGSCEREVMKGSYEVQMSQY